MSTTETIDIVINERGGVTVKRSIDNIAQSAQQASDKIGKLSTSADSFVAGLKRQADTLGFTRAQILAYDAAQLKLNETQRASVQQSIRTIEAYEKTQAAASKNVETTGILQNRFVALGAAYLSLSSIMAGGRAIVDTALANERLTNTLKVATNTAEEAAQEYLFLRKVSADLGLQLTVTGQQYAKLAAASKGSALEGQATRDIFIGVSKAATVLGLSADQAGGALLAIQQMISKGRVSAEELRGQLGERLPGAFQIAARAIGVTTAELDKMLEKGELTAEVLLPEMAKELEKTFGPQAQEAAQGLQSKINRLDNAFSDLKTAIGNTGLLDLLSKGIVLATRFTEALSGVKTLSAIDQQKQKIQELQDQLERKKGINNIAPIDNFFFNKKDLDSLEQQIDDGIADLKKLEKAAIDANEAVSGAKAIKPATKPALPEKLIKDQEKQIADARKAYEDSIEASQRFIDSIKKETAEIGLNSIQKRMLTAATQAAKAPNEKLRQEIMDSAAAYGQLALQQEKALAVEKDMQRIKQLDDQVATPQEKFDIARQELDRLREAGLSQETYNRALKKNEEELLDLKKTGRDVFGSIDQYAIQGARNIQTALANFLFDPFQDGLKGMVKGVIDAVRRMVAEFAAMKVAQTIGLTELFGSTATTANTAASGAGLLSTGSNLLGLANSGIGKAVGSGIGFIGRTTGLSSLVSVGSAANGAATAGVFGAGGMNFLGGAGTAIGTASEFGASAAIGAGISAVAGPAIIAFAADQLLRGLFGNKSLGGTAGQIVNAIPVIGPLIGGLFGHGPMKFRQEVAIGNANAQGFDGRVTDVFRAKGGLLVGNKHREQASPNEASMLDLFDTTIKGFGDSVKVFASNMGISTDTLNNYSKEIRLESEKGKRLTEEAVQELLNTVGNELAGTVLNQIDFIAKSGENNIQTLERLSKEFDVLNTAALAAGRSLEDARNEILKLPVTLRTQIVDQLGGVDAAGQKVGFFIDNFLSDSDKLAPMFDSLNIQMQKLGFSASITRDEFVTLIKSVGTAGGVTQDQFVGLMNIVQQFDQVDKLRTRLSQSTGNLIENERNLLDIRNDLTSTYQKERNEIEGTISRFTDLANQIKDFREGLLLGDLSPLTPGKKLEEARNEFNQVRAKAASGDQDALAKLPNVAQEFLKASQTYNASSGAFVSDFNLVQNVLKNSESAALSQAEISRRQLTSLDDSVKNLVDINGNTKTTVDLLQELITKSLKGDGNPTISTQQIKDFLAANPNMSAQQIANTAASYGLSKGQLVAAGVSSAVINKFVGGATVSDQEIKSFVAANINNPMAIYNAAVANGISSSRLSKVTGIAMADIEKFVKDNNLPSFARGTDFISRSGLAMVHRAEAIVPSSTTEEIKKLREELARLREEQNQQTGDMMKITDITSRQNAQAIAEAIAEIESRRQWDNRSRAAIK